MAAPYYNYNNGVYQGYPAGYPPPPPPPVAQPYGSPGRTTIVYEVPVDEYGNPIGAPYGQQQPVYVKGPPGAGYPYGRNQYYYGQGGGASGGDEALACCAGLCAALACCGLMDLIF
jgi:hypothetical protein